MWSWDVTEATATQNKTKLNAKNIFQQKHSLNWCSSCQVSHFYFQLTWWVNKVKPIADILIKSQEVWYSKCSQNILMKHNFCCRATRKATFLQQMPLWILFSVQLLNKF